MKLEGMGIGWSGRGRPSNIQPGLASSRMDLRMTADLLRNSKAKTELESLSTILQAE